MIASSSGSCASSTTFAKTIATPPRFPFVIHCFSPFSAYSSVAGSYVAVVDISAGFEPACGSERQNIPTG